MPDWEIEGNWDADWADLEVTYTDGHVEVIPGVRYQVSPDEPNPIKYVDEILSVETAGSHGLVLYMVGVRKFRFLGEGEQ